MRRVDETFRRPGHTAAVFSGAQHRVFNRGAEPEATRALFLRPPSLPFVSFVPEWQKQNLVVRRDGLTGLSRLRLRRASKLPLTTDPECAFVVCFVCVILLLPE